MTASLVQWRDDFLIGIAELDDEHKDLVKSFNAYASALNEEKDVQEVRKILGSLYGRLEMHFALEERVMREFDYNEFDTHKAKHNALLNDFSEFIDNFRANPGLEYEEMVGTRIGDWIVSHILKDDKKMASMIDYMTTEEREKIGNFFDPPS